MSVSRQRNESRSGTGGTTPTSARPEGPHALVLSGAGTLRIPLPAGRRATVGRSSSADAPLDDASLSRLHVAVSHDGSGSFVVEDLGSRNGTFLRGKRLDRGELVRLAPGEAIEIGDAVLFVAGEGPAAPVSTAEATDAWRSLDRLLPLVARGSIAVLLLGETGVGKEVTAQALHLASPRRASPFLAIHCAALPENLLEAELFGYERGAFTGAATQKPGLLESAEGGTVFLDEIGEVSLSTQAKLLRVLETRSVTRLGSVKPRTIDVRFVSATNRALDEMVRLGTFRSDLYYRLAGVALQVPSLRARVDDVTRLARRFVDEAAAAAKVRVPTISREALACLEAYEWPGNVRELRNVAECAVLLSDGAPIGLQHLPPHVRAARAPSGPRTPRPVSSAPPASSSDLLPAAPVSSARSLHDDRTELERRRILEALDQHGGNQTRAARALGIGRRTLIDRMASWGLPRPRKNGA